MRRSSGSVLLSVLWVVLVLSVVSFSLASTVRLEVTSNQESFDSERAFFMARGAAELVFNSFAKQLPIPKDSPIRQEKGEYIVPFEAGEARVKFQSDAGLIDLNRASDKMLASLFDSVGVDRETRNRLVDSILDWRDEDDIPHLYGAEVADYLQDAATRRKLPRNENFQSVDELILVKNMTREIFYGSFVVDQLSGGYRRIPGVRDLVTVRSGSEKVDPNVASYEVLLALPGANAESVKLLVLEREKKRFASPDDLVNRLPEFSRMETTDYFDLRGRMPVELVSRATVSSSGVSRSVRLLFRTEQKMQIITYNPLVYKFVTQSRLDRWRFE